MTATPRPRLGFLGAGWIGRHRLEAVVRSELGEIVAVSDPDPQALQAALDTAPEARQAAGLDELLSMELDGLVIATPSAFHAQQTTRALESGLAVFCQKPLGRSAEETSRVVRSAREADRLLGVDFSYRHTRAVESLRRAITVGELGRIFAVNLVFHNAYGPDKPWFYDPKQAGGGCVMDLGIHLVDLALWLLDFPKVEHVSSQILSQGEPVRSAAEVVEDFAAAQLVLEGGCSVQLACSWKLQAGCDCLIEASFFGTKGGASFHNVNGSFYDFVAERYDWTARRRLSDPPDEWGGRAVVEWTRRLASGERFDPAIERVVDVASTLDRIRARAG